MSCEAIPELVRGNDWSRAVVYRRRADKGAVAIGSGATVRAALVAKGTRAALAGPVSCSASAPGADWAAGVVVVTFSSVTTSDARLLAHRPGLVELVLEVDDGGRDEVFHLVWLRASGIS